MRYLALLTGNFKRGAQIKARVLRPVALLPSRRVRRRRARSQRAAVGRRSRASKLPAVRRSGRPRSVIVGDTPLDVAVAVAGGARSLGGGDRQLRRRGAARERRGCRARKILRDVEAVLDGLGLDVAGPG